MTGKDEVTRVLFKQDSSTLTVTATPEGTLRLQNRQFEDTQVIRANQKLEITWENGQVIGTRRPHGLERSALSDAQIDRVIEAVIEHLMEQTKAGDVIIEGSDTPADVFMEGTFDLDAAVRAGLKAL